MKSKWSYHIKAVYCVWNSSNKLSRRSVTPTEKSLNVKSFDWKRDKLIMQCEPHHLISTIALRFSEFNSILVQQWTNVFTSFWLQHWTCTKARKREIEIEFWQRKMRMVHEFNFVFAMQHRLLWKSLCTILFVHIGKSLLSCCHPCYTNKNVCVCVFSLDWLLYRMNVAFKIPGVDEQKIEMINKHSLSWIKNEEDCPLYFSHPVFCSFAFSLFL